MTGFLRVKSFYRGWIRERRRMGESYRCQRARRGGAGGRGGGEESMRVRESCLSACVRGYANVWACACAPQWVYACWHLALASHCGELSACLGCSLPLSRSLFSLLFPPSIFCPLLFAFFLSCISFTSLCLYYLLSLSLFLFKLSLTMVQDFYCLGRRRNNWQRWVGWIGRDGWLYWINVWISEFHFEFGER